MCKRLKFKNENVIKILKTLQALVFYFLIYFLCFVVSTNKIQFFLLILARDKGNLNLGRENKKFYLIITEKSCGFKWLFFREIFLRISFMKSSFISSDMHAANLVSN